MPKFYLIFAPKINKISEFYVMYVRKNEQNAPILHDFCPKNIFPEFGGMHPLPPSPTPMGSTMKGRGETAGKGKRKEWD